MTVRENLPEGYFTIDGEKYCLITFGDRHGDNDKVITVYIVAPDKRVVSSGEASGDNKLETAINHALYKLEATGVKCGMNANTLLKSLEKIEWD